MFLLNAAEAGDLRVNPDEARAAVTKLQNVADKLQALLQTMDAGIGTAKLELGDNTVGDAVAQKSDSKFSGGESLRAAVQMLFDQATNAHDAVKKAMDNYHYTDQSGALKFQPHH